MLGGEGGFVGTPAFCAEGVWIGVRREGMGEFEVEMRGGCFFGEFLAGVEMIEGKEGEEEC